MIEDSIAVVKRMAETFNRRDVPALLELLYPDVVWIPIMATLEGRVYRGHEGVCEWLEDLATDWEYFETYQEEHELIGDRVLIFGHWRARARNSGIELKELASWLADVRDGRVARLQTFTDRRDAIEASRLPAEFR
jgi:ketosteroid isomerase-like protein